MSGLRSGHWHDLSLPTTKNLSGDDPTIVIPSSYSRTSSQDCHSCICLCWGFPRWNDGSIAWNFLEGFIPSSHAENTHLSACLQTSRQPWRVRCAASSLWSASHQWAHFIRSHMWHCHVLHMMWFASDHELLLAFSMFFSSDHSDAGLLWFHPSKEPESKAWEDFFFYRSFLSMSYLAFLLFELPTLL